MSQISDAEYTQLLATQDQDLATALDWAESHYPHDLLLVKDMWAKMITKRTGDDHLDTLTAAVGSLAQLGFRYLMIEFHRQGRNFRDHP